MKKQKWEMILLSHFLVNIGSDSSIRSSKRNSLSPSHSLTFSVDTWQACWTATNKRKNINLNPGKIQEEISNLSKWVDFQRKLWLVKKRGAVKRSTCVYVSMIDWKVPNVHCPQEEATKYCFSWRLFKVCYKLGYDKNITEFNLSM